MSPVEAGGPEQCTGGAHVPSVGPQAGSAPGTQPCQSFTVACPPCSVLPRPLWLPPPTWGETATGLCKPHGSLSAPM